MVRMPRTPSPVLWLAGVTLVLLAACTGAPTPTTPTPRATPTPIPTPSPTPLPADTLSVGVLGLGVGTFDLAAIPVATLRKNARFHGARAVIVPFVTRRSGRTRCSLDLAPVNLGPDRTLAVTADCTDACN